MRAHTLAVDGSVVSLVPVPQQCYLVPGAPNLCLPMMAPPDITVGPPAVSVPTPPQCYPVSVGTTVICIPVVNTNQPICAQPPISVSGVCTTSGPIPTPGQCYAIQGTQRGICLPSTSPQPPRPGQCYRIPGFGKCLPLTGPVINPALLNPSRLTPGGPAPVASPTPIGGGSVKPLPLTVPTSASVLGCLAAFAQKADASPVQPVPPTAPINSVSCENVLAPTVDMVYARASPNYPCCGGGGGGPTPYSDGAFVNFGLASSYWDQNEMDNLYGPNRVLWGQYARFGVSLDCQNELPSSDYPRSGNPNNWWEIGGPLSGPRAGANAQIAGTSFDVLQRAFNDDVLPIDELSIGPVSQDCSAHDPSEFAFDEFNDYGSELLQHFSSFPRLTYFEIQNEPNEAPSETPSWVYDQNNADTYGYYFTNAAVGLYNSLVENGGISNWVALTGGMTRPTADVNGCGTSTLYQAENAVNTAEYYGIPPENLGAAVHPYSDAGGGNYYFPYWYNFDTYWGVSQYRGFDNTCFSFEGMANTWTNAFPYMPVVITEINWASDATYNGAYDHNDPYIQPNLTNFQAAYLADVFTWMGDHGFATSNSQLRLAWFTHSDFSVVDPATGNTITHALGLYDQNGNDTKAAALPYCPGDSGLQSAYTEPIIYGQMAYYRCY